MTQNIGSSDGFLVLVYQIHNGMSKFPVSWF
jgi:hypothetical protein